MNTNSQESLLNEIFASIDIIAKKRIEETSFTQTIKARIIERIPGSDMFRVQYQNEELRAMAMSNMDLTQGDIVYILVPDKRLDNLKFILGKTNERTPTITGSQTSGLSPEVLAEIQEAILSLDKILSDKMIIPAEKSELMVLYTKINGNFETVREQAVQHGIDVSDLINRHQELMSYDVILENLDTMTTEDDLIEQLGKNFADMKTAFGDYFAQEQASRIAILNKLASYGKYQVSISSSDGNLFVNGSVNTTLTATVFRGVDNVTLALPSSSIKWRKLNQDGTEDPNWSKFGPSVHITVADINMKATFQVEVLVEEAKVATAQTTIVDFSDSSSLQLFVQPNHPSIQIYNVDNYTYNPDWQSNHLILDLSAYTTSSNQDVSNKLSNIIWKKNGTILSTDSNYEIMANGSLKVKRNDMEGEEFVRYEVSASYNDNGVVISASAMAEFAKVSISTSSSDQEPISFVYLVHPDGTVFKNASPTDAKRVQTVYMEGAVQVLNNLSYKWYYADPSVLVGDPNYDEDGGVGWSLISDTNNIDGNLSGYSGPTLNVKANAVDNSETFKVSIRHGTKPPMISITTLVDITDPHQVIIEGDNVFKNGVGTLNLRARVLLDGTEVLDLSRYSFDWRAYDSDGILFPSWSANTQTVSVNHNEVPEKGYFTCDINLT